jgi:rhodanese-related sulfurtransferase
MKELEKTKRISIASTLFILIILIALLTYKRPKFLYKVNSAQTLEKIVSNDFIISLNDIYNPNYVLIDIRDQFEFEKAHLENSINISTPSILDEASIDFFDKLKQENKTVIMYGNNPEEVNAPFMLLYQLGYNNIKILAAENSYFQNNLLAKRVDIEKSENDVNAFIAESLKNANSGLKQKVVIKKPVKKVITVKKKKKAPAEGGC